MARPIDKEFEEADDTGVLDISGRKLRQFPTIPRDLLDFNYIFEADLSSNRFDKVPKEVILFKALVKLNCHYNSIRWLPEELHLLTNLKEIDFSRNFLQRFPTELCSMNLYSVNLSNNRLNSIPAEIGKLKNTQFLDLSCNMLSELPESFYTLSNLRHLNLHRNHLRDLSEDIYQLTELQYLDVSSNYLCRLPTALRVLECLQIFTADSNPLEFPPPQVCCRGLVHLCKYLETLEKKGSNPHLLAANQRDESLRRRKDRSNRKSGMHRPMMESSPMPNGRDPGIGLLDEMANLVNKTFGDGDVTPTSGGSLHWSITQYMTPEKNTCMSSQSREEYREAAYRLYMQQEGIKEKHDMNAHSPTSTHPTSSSKSPTSPQRKSDENVYRSSTMAGSTEANRPTFMMGRSLSNEKFPRSGSWNSHMRISSPVLPSKYVADRSSDEKTSSENNMASLDADENMKSSHSATELHTDSNTKAVSTKQEPSNSPVNAQKKRPPPLDTSNKPLNGEKGEDSDHEGSLTPTNESPPALDLEEPSTPKDEKSFSNITEDAIKDKLVKDGLVKEDDPDAIVLQTVPVNKSVSFSSSVEDIPPSTRTQGRPNKPLPVPPPKPKSPRRSVSLSDSDGTDLNNSPTSIKRLPSVSPEPDSSKDTVPLPEDETWTRLASPRRKKEKDVFKFLKDSEPNYTIRRQQMQMSLIIEKNQHVKKTVENLLGLQLSDDIGEWVMDGVILCQVVNILHPGTISTIHSPPPGQSLSRIKRTINISAFIDACKTLKVPEEELCSAGDIVELKDPVRVITCIQRVLETKPGNLI